MAEPSACGSRGGRGGRRERARGFTLIEVIVALAVIGIVAVVGALHLKPFDNPLHDAATNLSGLLKQSRAKAMATTSAYRVVRDPAGGSHLITETAVSCAAAATAWHADDRLTLDLPADITLSVTGGSAPACFDPRGTANEDVVYRLVDGKGRRLDVEVMLGGAVRIRS